MGFFDCLNTGVADEFDDFDDDDVVEELAYDFQTINRGDIVVYNTKSHLFMRGERELAQRETDIKIGVAVDQSADRHAAAVMLGHFLTKEPLAGTNSQIINKLKRSGDAFKRACPDYRELKHMKLRVPTSEMIDMLLEPYIRESYEYFNGRERSDAMYDKLKTYAVLVQDAGKLKIWKYNRRIEKGETLEFGRGFMNKDYGMYLPVIILDTYKARRKK